MAVKRLKPTEKDKVDQLLDLLKSKGVITAQEAKDVKDKKNK